MRPGNTPQTRIIQTGCFLSFLYVYLYSEISLNTFSSVSWSHELNTVTLRGLVFLLRMAANLGVNLANVDSKQRVYGILQVLYEWSVYGYAHLQQLHLKWRCMVAVQSEEWGRSPNFRGVTPYRNTKRSWTATKLYRRTLIPVIRYIQCL